jgi:hydroxyacylglutathione hydrolase
MKVIQIPVNGFDNNFSYLIIGKNNESILIDPTGDLNKILKEINNNNLKIVLVLLTHSHPDHSENLNYFSNVKAIIPKKGLVGEEESIKINEFIIKLIHLPGHTKDSVVYLLENNLFSGDTLFCRGIGTTTYGGNEIDLKNSLNFLSSLNKKIVLWPGHNYGGNSCTLKEALINSKIKPSKKTLDLIKNKVKKYELKSSKKVRE